MISPAEYAEMIAAKDQRLIEAGVRIGEQLAYARIRALDEAYRQACLNPDTKIPTYLTAVIHSLVLMLPPGETVLDKMNEHANAGVKRDQLKRHEGREDHDMNTGGTKLVPGR